MTKLKKISFRQNSKTQIVTKMKKKKQILTKTKTQIVTKQKNQIVTKLKILIVTRLKKANCDKTQKIIF